MLSAHSVVIDSAPFETTTIGGTFHAMHIGHRRYIEIAFSVARWTYIHITTDEFARALKPYRVKPFEARRQQIENFLDEFGWRERAEIRALESPDQLRRFCIETSLSIVVVEPAYLETFRQLNGERRSSGLEEYCILMKPRTRVEGDLDVSSRSVEASHPTA